MKSKNTGKNYRTINRVVQLKIDECFNEVGTPFKELQQVLPAHSRNEIQVLMRELRNAGKVICVGKTSAARWFLAK